MGTGIDGLLLNSQMHMFIGDIRGWHHGIFKAGARVELRLKCIYVYKPENKSTRGIIPY